MSDLISRSALIKDIEYYISHTLEDSGEHYAYKQAKRLVEKQPSVEPVRGEWIPCSERFPEEEYDTVLTVTDKNHYCVAVYTTEYGFRTADIDCEGEFVAWMPLPEPYDMRKKVKE